MTARGDTEDPFRVDLHLSPPYRTTPMFAAWLPSYKGYKEHRAITAMIPIGAPFMQRTGATTFCRSSLRGATHAVGTRANPDQLKIVKRRA